MRVSKLARDGEAKAGALGTAGHERLEQTLRHLGRHTGASVRDR